MSGDPSQVTRAKMSHNSMFYSIYLLNEIVSIIMINSCPYESDHRDHNSTSTTTLSTTI